MLQIKVSGRDKMGIPTDMISKRKLEIAKRQAAGETEKAIAKELGISINTVRYHKKKLYRTLGVDNIVSAILEMKNRKIL